MVHYDSIGAVAQTHPPTCPKCGSHRTEIVGRTDNGATLVLRCNACGERSRVSVPVDDQSSKTADAIHSVTPL
jgi:uncharacterized Zn finger protein